MDITSFAGAKWARQWIQVATFISFYSRKSSGYYISLFLFFKLIYCKHNLHFICIIRGGRSWFVGSSGNWVIGEEVDNVVMIFIFKRERVGIFLNNKTDWFFVNLSLCSMQNTQSVREEQKRNFLVCFKAKLRVLGFIINHVWFHMIICIFFSTLVQKCRLFYYKQCSSSSSQIELKRKFGYPRAAVELFSALF